MSWTATWVQDQPRPFDLVTIRTEYGHGRAGIHQLLFTVDGRVAIEATGYGPFELSSAPNARTASQIDPPDGVEVFDGPDYRSRRVPR
jgi:hypothetical protein